MVHEYNHRYLVNKGRRIVNLRPTLAKLGKPYFKDKGLGVLYKCWRAYLAFLRFWVQSPVLWKEKKKERGSKMMTKVQKLTA
jgi:hypothetical protein